MKTLGEIAYEAWWTALTGKPQTGEEWGDNPAWDAAAAAVSEAIFARLEAVLDEGDAEEKPPEDWGTRLYKAGVRLRDDVQNPPPRFSNMEVCDVYQAGCK